MVAHICTVSFFGIEAKPVDVQVQVTSGLPAFTIVGLPDKAVAESRERVRGALSAVGLALPAKHITVSWPLISRISTEGGASTSISGFGGESTCVPLM